MLSLWTHNWLCLSSFANHLLACYRWSRPSLFFLLYNWANPFQVEVLCKPFESSLILKYKMCHSLNLEHNEDIDYLTLSLREQMIVSHKYGSSLGELLLIQGSMRKFVNFMVQFIQKKKEEKKIGANKLGIGFICSIEKGEKYFHDLNSCSLSSRYFCYPEKPNFLLSLATIQAIKVLVMITCLWKF